MEYLEFLDLRNRKVREICVSLKEHLQTERRLGVEGNEILSQGQCHPDPKSAFKSVYSTFLCDMQMCEFSIIIQLLQNSSEMTG